jgi:hypothetical protein
VSLRHPFRIFRDDDWKLHLLAIAFLPIIVAVELAEKYRRWRTP